MSPALTGGFFTTEPPGKLIPSIYLRLNKIRIYGTIMAGIKIARRNINNLRYADDNTLMAESEEEPKSFLMKWKRRVKKLA